MFHAAARIFKTLSRIFQHGHRDLGGAWAVTLEGNVNGQVQVGGREGGGEGKVGILHVVGEGRN